MTKRLIRLGIVFAAMLSIFSVSGFAQVTKGTAKSGAQTTASTTLTISAFSASANATLVCGATFDDNGETNSISSIVVGGSPTYSTAWTQVARSFGASAGGIEVWKAYATTAITSQTVTITFSGSEKSSGVCQSYTGTDSANAGIPTSASAAVATVNVTSGGNDNSLYGGFIGCGSNSSSTLTAGTGYTKDASANESTSSVWAISGLETKNAAVSPAATTTVNFTNTGCNGSGSFIRIIGFELKKASGSVPNSANISVSFTTAPAVAVSAGRPVAISDSATVSPAVAATSGRSAAPSDTVTASPAVGISAGRSTAPAVTVTTAPAVAVSAGRSAAPSDTVTTSPAVTAALGRGAPMSETATTSPAVATQAAFNRTQADSVSSSPAVSVSAGRSAALAVTITTAPSLSVQSGKGAPVSDSFSLSPAVTAQAAHNAAMSDSVGSVPAVTLQVGRNQALAQSLTVAPALLVQAGKSLAISEAAAFGDAVATRLDRKRSIAEGITAADSLSVVVHVGGQRRRSVIIG